MGSAVLPARRRAAVSIWTVAPTAVALAFGLAFLVLEPRPGDLAVHVFRAELFGREGFTFWNGDWYGGHHTPAYSVLSPPLSWLVGPRVLLVASCVACAALFERLARGHFGAERARLGALWFGFGTVTLLATSRLPFALGTAFGLAAALALQRGRPRLAVAFAFLSPLASPVAGLFTGDRGTRVRLGCAGPGAGGRRRGRRRTPAAGPAVDRLPRGRLGALPVHGIPADSDLLRGLPGRAPARRAGASGRGGAVRDRRHARRCRRDAGGRHGPAARDAVRRAVAAVRGL